jgi:heptosyltransferase-2
LCPGAEFGPAKRWPPEYFAAVARDRLGRGWRVWLFGSDKDSVAAADIVRLGGAECVDLTGRTPLADAIDLMSLARVVVTNDSGLMHIAAGLGRQVIALYGSSSPGFTPPLSADAQVLRLDLECSPCFQRECPLGHLKCLREITPNMVLTSIDKISG